MPVCWLSLHSAWRERIRRVPISNKEILDAI